MDDHLTKLYALSNGKLNNLRYTHTLMSATAEFLTIIYSTFTPLILIVGTVLTVSKRVQLDPRTFSRIIIYLFSPCLVLNSISTSEMSGTEMGSIIGATITSGIAMAAVATLIARLLKLERRLASTFVLTAIVMNGLNFGIPFIEFAFGAEAFDRAVIFNVGQIFLVYTLGVFVISRGSGSVLESIKNVFSIPLPYAFALGVLLNVMGWSLPQPAERAVGVLAQATVPCALVILGLQLGSADLKGRWRELWAIAGTRFIVGGLIAFTAATVFALSGLSRQAFIVQYSMPVGVTSGVLATEFDGDAEFAAAGVLFTTLLSIIPLSFLLFLVG